MEYRNLGTVYHDGNFKVSFTIKLNSVASGGRNGWNWRNILMFKHKNFMWCTPAFYLWPNSNTIYPIIFNKNGLWVLLPKEMYGGYHNQWWDTAPRSELNLPIGQPAKVELSIVNRNITFAINGKEKKYVMRQWHWGNWWYNKFTNTPIEVTTGIPEYRNWAWGDFGKPPDAEMRDLCFHPNYTG